MPVGGSCEANTIAGTLDPTNMRRNYDVPGVYSSSAVAQFNDDMTAVISGGKFIWTVHGYAGGESTSHIVISRPLPVEFGSES